MLQALCSVPLGWRLATVRWLQRRGWLYGPRSSTARLIRINLERCFPQLSDPEREQLHRDTLAVAGAAGAVTLQLLVRGPQRHGVQVRWHGLEHLEAARARGERVLLLALHSWMVLAAPMLLCQRGYALSGLLKVVNQPEKQARLAGWLSRWADPVGTTQHRRGDGLHAFLRDMQQLGIGVFSPDLDLGPQHAAFAPFFGTRKATQTTVRTLLRRCPAVVIPLMASIDPRTGVLDIECRPATADLRQMDDAAVATHINQLVEQAFRDRPAQYMWKLKLLRTVPAGDMPPY